nr:DnaJ domain-containing protein [Alsobacter ponti]
MIAGVATLILIWWLAKSFAGANPTRLASATRKMGGVAALGAAGLLAFRGRIDIAIPLGGFGAWLLGIQGIPLPGFGSTTKTPGGTSRVRSAMLEMVLDHDTGALGGRVLAGPLEGRSLDSLGEPELAQLAATCRRSDPDGLRLLEAYLDRRFPGRSKAAEADADAGAPPRRDSGAMTEQEAYEILGLQPGATEEQVRGAHRALMKKLHPDQGGSTYLATRVNQAKDVLLNRHR